MVDFGCTSNDLNRWETPKGIRRPRSAAFAANSTRREGRMNESHKCQHCGIDGKVIDSRNTEIDTLEARLSALEAIIPLAKELGRDVARVAENFRQGTNLSEQLEYLDKRVKPLLTALDALEKKGEADLKEDGDVN